MSGTRSCQCLLTASFFSQTGTSLYTCPDLCSRKLRTIFDASLTASQDQSLPVAHCFLDKQEKVMLAKKFLQLCFTGWSIEVFKCFACLAPESSEQRVLSLAYQKKSLNNRVNQVTCLCRGGVEHTNQHRPKP